ncbi:F-box protein [Candidatus Odyssella thessalonicensis]|uniref:F-box protein n=1 Tax=Candidatus Odyssella thessalonicensis TaxID=84647 RepID=UPI000225C092|nr:F-box protein [Candidatus Odyssella thessalonicensis]
MPLIRKILPYIICSVLSIASASDDSDENDNLSEQTRFPIYIPRTVLSEADQATLFHAPLLGWEGNYKAVWRKQALPTPTFRNSPQDEELPENVMVFPFLALPNELLAQILYFLPSQDFLHINEVCQKFYKISTNSSDIKLHTLTVLNRIDPYGITAQEVSQRFLSLLDHGKKTINKDDRREIQAFLQESESYLSTLYENIKHLLPLYRRLGGYKPSQEWIRLKDNLSESPLTKYYLKSRGIIHTLTSEERETYRLLRRLSKYNGGQSTDKTDPILLDLISVAPRHFPCIPYESLKRIKQKEFNPFSRLEVLDLYPKIINYTEVGFEDIYASYATFLNSTLELFRKPRVTNLLSPDGSYFPEDESYWELRLPLTDVQVIWRGTSLE